MSHRAESVLAKMGVQAETGKMLLRDANNTWKDSSGKSYVADLVIPAVGIDLNTDLISGVEKTERSALIVDPDLRLKNFKNVFAAPKLYLIYWIGDSINTNLMQF
jgi:NADH dehydrogenase FAD-containing subunit